MTASKRSPGDLSFQPNRPPALPAAKKEQPGRRPRHVIETAHGYWLMRADSRDWLRALPTIGRCLFCPGVEFVGTAAEVQAWNREHRQTVHPDRKPVGVMERRRAASKAGAFPKGPLS